MSVATGEDIESDEETQQAQQQPQQQAQQQVVVAGEEPEDDEDNAGAQSAPAAATAAAAAIASTPLAATQSTPAAQPTRSVQHPLISLRVAHWLDLLFRILRSSVRRRAVRLVHQRSSDSRPQLGRHKPNSCSSSILGSASSVCCQLICFPFITTIYSFMSVILLSTARRTQRWVSAVLCDGHVSLAQESVLGHQPSRSAAVQDAKHRAGPLEAALVLDSVATQDNI